MSRLIGSSANGSSFKGTQPNRNAPFLRGNSGCVTVTLRQKKEKPILTRGQEHFNVTCMRTTKLLMIRTGITPDLCGEVKQVTVLWKA